MCRPEPACWQAVPAPLVPASSASPQTSSTAASGRHVAARVAGPLIAEPEVTRLELSPLDEFVLLACDGLFDVMSSQRAVELARTSLREHNHPQQCAEELVRGAASHGEGWGGIGDAETQRAGESAHLHGAALMLLPCPAALPGSLGAGPMHACAHRRTLSGCEAVRLGCDAVGELGLCGSTSQRAPMVHTPCSCAAVQVAEAIRRHSSDNVTVGNQGPGLQGF